jgi:hypothetical protein
MIPNINSKSIAVTPRDLTDIADSKKLSPIPIMKVRNIVTPKSTTLSIDTPTRGVTNAIPAVRGIYE